MLRVAQNVNTHKQFVGGPVGVADVLYAVMSMSSYAAMWITQVFPVSVNVDSSTAVARSFADEDVKHRLWSRQNHLAGHHV